MWRLCCPNLFVISPFFGAQGGLCFVIMAFLGYLYFYEPAHDKTNKMACAPREDSDQPVHPPSLIRVFAVHIKKVLVLSYPLSELRRLWLDWVDAQADLGYRWAHMPFLLVLSWVGLYPCILFVLVCLFFLLMSMVDYVEWMWLVLPGHLIYYSWLSLSRILRDFLKHFEISVPRNIRVAEMRKTMSNNHI